MSIADLKLFFSSSFGRGRNEALNGKNSAGQTSGYMMIVTFCLRVSGLWKSSGERTLNLPVILTVLLPMFVGMVGTVHQLLFVPQDLYARTEVLMNVTLIGHSISTFIVLIWKQKTIMRMLSLVECKFNGFCKVQKLTSEYWDNAEKKNAILVVSISVIIFSVHLSFIGVSKVFWVYSPAEEKSLLFPITVPLQMSNPVYYSVYCLELVVTLCEAVVHITSITLCTGFINLLCAEFAVLGLAYRSTMSLARQHALLCPGLELPPDCLPEEHLNYHADVLFRDYITHHTLLIRFYKDLQSSFSLPILDMFVNSQIMLCSSGFHIFKLCQAGAVQQLFKQLCMFAALISHEFVYFWFGSRLTEKVDRFRDDVYACQWTARSPSFKKGYRILLERIKRSIVIHAFVLPANLATFAKCLQAAFSYFNLLMALNYKQEHLLRQRQ